MRKPRNLQTHKKTPTRKSSYDQAPVSRIGKRRSGIGFGQNGYEEEESGVLLKDEFKRLKSTVTISPAGSGLEFGDHEFHKDTERIQPARALPTKLRF